MDFDARRFATPTAILKISQILVSIILLALIGAMYNKPITDGTMQFGCTLPPPTNTTTPPTTPTPPATTANSTTASTTPSKSGKKTPEVTSTPKPPETTKATSQPATEATTSAEQTNARFKRDAATNPTTKSSNKSTTTPTPGSTPAPCAYKMSVVGGKGFMNFTAAEILIWAVLTLVAVVLGFAHGLQEDNYRMAVMPEIIQAGLTGVFAFACMCIAASKAATLAKYDAPKYSNASDASGYHSKFTWAAIFWVIQFLTHVLTGLLALFKGWP